MLKCEPKGHLQIMSDPVKILISPVFSIQFADSELKTKSEQTGLSSATIAVDRI